MSMPNKINNGPSLIHKITVSECVYSSFFSIRFGLVGCHTLCAHNVLGNASARNLRMCVCVVLTDLQIFGLKCQC